VNLRPLSQDHVDLEEIAAFAVQAFCAGVSGRDPRPALANVRASLDRIEASLAYQDDLARAQGAARRHEEPAS
jgi:hypothetical protein